MSDITDYPALPVQDRDEREFERKHADAINYLLQRAADLDDRVADNESDIIAIAKLIDGYRVADNLTEGGIPLPDPSTLAQGNYYIVTQAGTTSAVSGNNWPNIENQTFAVGDTLHVTDTGVYFAVEQPTNYISSEFDDTAAGKITFTLNPISNQNATTTTGLVRKGQMDTADTNLQNQIDSNDSDIISLYAQIISNDNDIAALQGRVTQNESDIATLQTLIVDLQPAGYGGGVQNAVISPFNIPASPNYTTLEFDTLAPAGRGVTFTTATNTFAFDHAGVWTLIVNFSIEGFNSSNSGRSFYARLYNVTDSIADDGIVIGIGRNMEDVSNSTTMLVTITDADVTNGVSFRVVLGGGDAISGGDLIAGSIQATYEDRLGPI